MSPLHNRWRVYYYDPLYFRHKCSCFPYFLVLLNIFLMTEVMTAVLGSWFYIYPSDWTQFHGICSQGNCSVLSFLTKISLPFPDLTSVSNYRFIFHNNLFGDIHMSSLISSPPTSTLIPTASWLELHHFQNTRLFLKPWCFPSDLDPAGCFQNTLSCFLSWFNIFRKTKPLKPKAFPPLR